MFELRSEPLVFVADVDAPELDARTHNHLARSLRLKVGDRFNVSDGTGNWRAARLSPEGLEVDGPVRQEPRAASPTAVAFAPVKGDRSAWIVQKLTELNIDEIFLIETERSVVRWDANRKVKQLEKLMRTAVEACGQCRRVWIPTITFATLNEIVAKPGAVLADPDGRDLHSADRIVAIGPEGGWSPAEAELADHVRLPGAVLRAETAAMAAAVQLGAHPQS